MIEMIEIVIDMIEKDIINQIDTIELIGSVRRVEPVAEIEMKREVNIEDIPDQDLAHTNIIMFKFNKII